MSGSSAAVVEQRVMIDRPQHQVETAMVDPDVAFLCWANVIEYHVVSGTPGRVGTQVRAAKKLGREVCRFLVEVIAAEPGRWLESRSIDAAIDLRIETRLQDATGRRA